MLKKNPKVSKNVQVFTADSMIDLIKQSQLTTGKSAKIFIVDDTVVKVGFDGQNLVSGGVLCNDICQSHNVFTEE